MKKNISLVSLGIMSLFLSSCGFIATEDGFVLIGDNNFDLGEYNGIYAIIGIMFAIIIVGGFIAGIVTSIKNKK